MANTCDLFKKPTVSLIITCHNLSKFLPECILSIQKQTYEKCEIIIVDDFSSDNTKDVMKNIKNVEKIYLEENLGQFGAFLEGLKRAKGEFICMVDADDVLLPNFVEKHIEAHMQVSVALTSCAQIEIDENSTLHCLNSVASATFKNDATSTEDKISVIKKLTFGTWAWNPSSSAMMRRSALEPLLLYKNPKEWSKCADKLIFSFLHLIGGSANISGALMAYRVHGNNLTSANKVIGNKKYIKPDTIRLLVHYNKRLRLDTLGLILGNRKYFNETFNALNVRKMVWQIVFSFDYNTIKRIFKSLTA